MATYNVHAGHCPDGSGACGAVGYIKESTEAREVKNRVISRLRSLGHTVYDCTDDGKHTVNENLKAIVSKCNQHRADVDVSIHFNAGGGQGCEVWVWPGSKVKGVAANICEAISKRGFKNRGVKESGGLYVLKHTYNPALLVECCFVDTYSDTELYNADEMAAAIVEGLTGKAGSQRSTAASNAETSGNTASNSGNAFPLPSGHWFGTPSANDRNHSGYYNAADRPAIKKIQAKVGATQDGYYGTDTKKKVLKYQKENSDCGKPDGLTGILTWNSMFN